MLEGGLTDDDEDEDERTQERAAFVQARPVGARFLGRRLDAPLTVRADPKAMAVMKSGRSSLEIPTPELVLNPPTDRARDPAPTVEEETAPTLNFVPEARAKATSAEEIEVHVSPAEEEPDTVMESHSPRVVFGDQEQDSAITPKAAENVMRLLRRAAQPSLADAEAAQKTTTEVAEDHLTSKTLELPRPRGGPAPPTVASAAAAHVPPQPLPPAMAASPRRGRWLVPTVLLLLLIATGAVLAQSSAGRSAIGALWTRIHP